MGFKLSTSIFTLAIILAALEKSGTSIIYTTSEFSRVKIDVYYESLCGPSMRFFRRKLIPSYRLFKELVNITFVPYGNAKHTQDPITGQWKFECQHGVKECKGNKGQVCGLAEIENLSLNFQQRQDLAVDFVGCVMSHRQPPIAISECAEHVNLTEDFRNRIKQCESNAEGDELLAEAGNKTKSVKPPITGVPSVFVRDKFNKNQRYNGIVKFTEFVCKFIPEKFKPWNCYF